MAPYTNCQICNLPQLVYFTKNYMTTPLLLWLDCKVNMVGIEDLSYYSLYKTEYESRVINTIAMYLSTQAFP